jgi:hypothetical protein
VKQTPSFTGELASITAELDRVRQANDLTPTRKAAAIETLERKLATLSGASDLRVTESVTEFGGACHDGLAHLAPKSSDEREPEEWTQTGLIGIKGNQTWRAVANAPGLDVSRVQ